MWWAFRRHRLAMVGLSSRSLLYLVALFPSSSPSRSRTSRTAAPPTTRRRRSTSSTRARPAAWSFRPYVHPDEADARSGHAGRHFEPDTSRKIRSQLFGEGYDYSCFGLFPTDSAPARLRPIRSEPLYLFGADRLGRDVLSRIIHGAQISLSIGLVGVVLVAAPRRRARRHLRLLRRPHRHRHPARRSSSCWRCRPSRSGWRWPRRCRWTGRRARTIS